MTSADSGRFAQFPTFAPCCLQNFMIPLNFEEDDKVPKAEGPKAEGVCIEHE